MVFLFTLGFSDGLTFVRDAAGPVLGVIAPGVFAVLGSIWILLAGQATGWKRRLGIIVVIVLSILIISPIGGLLWAIQDMQSWQHQSLSDFPDFNPDSGEHILRGMGLGLMLGPWILLGLLPLTGWLWAAWYLILDKVERSFRPNSKNETKCLFS
ncbi:MAG: hypothetical protein K1Y36_20745 [Blastocatellia bacterium]|nr:hypothetical protein [Blastocatellia bacterium]